MFIEFTRIDFQHMSEDTFENLGRQTENIPNVLYSYQGHSVQSWEALEYIYNTVQNRFNRFTESFYQSDFDMRLIFDERELEELEYYLRINCAFCLMHSSVFSDFQGFIEYWTFSHRIITYDKNLKRMKKFFKKIVVKEMEDWNTANEFWEYISLYYAFPEFESPFLIDGLLI